MERPEDVVVIGIAGATRSGKSTLAKALAERLGIDPLLDIISADRFFKVLAECSFPPPYTLVATKTFQL